MNQPEPKSVWVLGAEGMLAKELCRTLTQNNIRVIGTGREVSVTDFSGLKAFARNRKISFIVNCAAYTKVDDAETDEETARNVNCLGAENAARMAFLLSVPLIHISTDYVFDGSSSSPLREKMAANPLNVYGKTKYEGEKEVSFCCVDCYILRTSWLYGFYGNNFVYKMLSLMNKNKTVRVVNDQTGCPTSCATVSKVILKIIQKRLKNEKVSCGIYHVTDSGSATWFDFACTIYEEGKKLSLIKNDECRIIPCSTGDFPQKAVRPFYSVMDTKKIQEKLNVSLPYWKDSLKEFFCSPFFRKKMLF